MPKNRFGSGIEAAPYNRYDGFSPGNMIVTKVPGLETPEAFKQTGAVPISDVARSFDPDQPVVVINARTGERQLIWSEIDSNPANPRDVTLIVRPAVNFAEGERYIVALRNLKNAQGEHDPGRSRLPALPRRPEDRRARDRAPARPLRGCVRHARQCGHRAQRTSTWPGTSRSRASAASPSGCFTCATTRSRSSATPTSPT